MKRRLKNPADAAKYRNEVLKKQANIDPITKELIRKPVLDHFHEEKQYCRGVLENEVNAWEGKVFNSYRRYVRHLTDMPLPELLRNLADYLESVPSEDEMVIHHTALGLDVRKFKSLPSTEQCSILTSLGVEPDKNSLLRSKQIRKFIKDGTFCIYDYLKSKKGRP